MQVKYIVQNLETHEFLCPDPHGDITETPFIKMAGQYEYIEDALDGARDIDGPFAIFQFYLPD